MNHKAPETRVHGWIGILKPEGPTSFDVIRSVRRAFPKVKCGHAGTLDPLATGVLPVALGEATKLISYMMDRQKTYDFEVTWGEQRATDDREGEVLAVCDARPSPDDIQAILPVFKGDIQQFPPLFSAVRINGLRACDRARRNEKVELAARNVKIFELLYLGSPDENRALFRVVCGKGTYVRSLARDMGQILGCLAYASRIHRVCVGSFHEDRGLPLEVLANEAQKGVLEEYIQPLDVVLDDIPAAQGDGSVVQALRKGQSILLEGVTFWRGTPAESGPVLACAEDQKAVAIAEVRDGRIWPRRVFNF